MKLSMIVALDRNRGIGQGNAMPWHLPDDFKHFKALTLGKPILMGRKTAESIGRVLPGRTTVGRPRGGGVRWEGGGGGASRDEARAIADRGGARVLCTTGGGEFSHQLRPQPSALSLPGGEAEAPADT